MGHRLSKIYTRTGDAGTTGLGDGNRVSKNSLRIHALGEVDELNACVGLLLAETLPEDIDALLVGGFRITSYNVCYTKLYDTGRTILRTWCCPVH